MISPETETADDAAGELWQRDPMVNWLKANAVDWDRVVAWPEIEWTDTTLWVEQFLLAADGEAAVHPGFSGEVYTGLVEYPLVVPPDPAFWAAYQHTRPQAIRRAELRRFARELRNHGGLPGFPTATVVMLEQGDSLLFVAQDPIPDENSGRMVETLRGLLPGVETAIVCGFDMLMHRPASGGR